MIQKHSNTNIRKLFTKVACFLETFFLFLNGKNMSHLWRRINFGISSFIRQPKRMMIPRVYSMNKASIVTHLDKSDPIIESTLNSKVSQPIWNQYKIETIQHNLLAKNDEVVFELKLVDMASEDKFQTFKKEFTCKDITDLKRACVVDGLISTEKFVEFILHSLSVKNEKYAVSYNIVKDSSKHLLNIDIHYISDFLDFKLNMEIPAMKMNETDLLKLRLHEAETKIAQLSKTVTTFSAIICKSQNETKAGAYLLRTKSDDDMISIENESKFKIQPGSYVVTGLWHSDQGRRVRLCKGPDKFVAEGRSYNYCLEIRIYAIINSNEEDLFSLGFYDNNGNERESIDGILSFQKIG